jgi:hypothetical protein
MIDADYVSELEHEVQDIASKLKAATDRIKKLEDGLRDVFSLGEWGTSALARTIILEALDEKD